MQRAYISALYSLMQQDKRVVSLLSDSGTDYDELMSREMPQQCYNFGISEQNKLGIAAGNVRQASVRIHLRRISRFPRI